MMFRYNFCLAPGLSGKPAVRSGPVQTGKLLCRESRVHSGEADMCEFWHKLASNENGQDIAEYAVMLAVILVIVVGTIRLIGGNANNVFSSVASSISQ